MSKETLSSVISLIVAIIILISSFFQWKDVLPWEGKIKNKKWVQFLFILCILLLFVALILIIK